jgi:2-oxoglutarate dehydrogenase E1 component
MESLSNYSVGGTIHIIMNNQIAFTTTPDRGRSGTYSSDVAKMINAPIFHVNGDDMEAVAKVFGIAAEYRQEFKKDVVIDLIGYRQLGHNELDNPSFTSPLTYKIVKNMKPTKDIYKAQLISEGID